MMCVSEGVQASVTHLQGGYPGGRFVRSWAIHREAWLGAHRLVRPRSAPSPRSCSRICMRTSEYGVLGAFSRKFTVRCDGRLDSHTFCCKNSDFEPSQTSNHKASDVSL